MEIFNPEKQWMKDHQILPRISFEPDKPRIVKIIERKREKFTNTEDELVDGIKYKVLEDGEIKTFFTASRVLIEELANIQDETTVKIMQKKVREKGQIKTTYEIDIISEEIPIIEDKEELLTESDVCSEKEEDEPPSRLFD